MLIELTLHFFGSNATGPLWLRRLTVPLNTESTTRAELLDTIRRVAVHQGITAPISENLISFRWLHKDTGSINISSPSAESPETQRSPTSSYIRYHQVLVRVPIAVPIQAHQPYTYAVPRVQQRPGYLIQPYQTQAHLGLAHAGGNLYSPAIRGAGPMNYAAYPVQVQQNAGYGVGVGYIPAVGYAHMHMVQNQVVPEVVIVPGPPPASTAAGQAKAGGPARLETTGLIKQLDFADLTDETWRGALEFSGDDTKLVVLVDVNAGGISGGT